MPREHGDSGEFVETVTFEDVLGVFDQVRGPVVLSADVADALECTRQTARRKLERLYERGQLDRRKTARRVVYWRPGTETDESGRERRESAPADTPVDLDSLTFERQLTAARRDVLTDWVDHVRATGDSVKKSDFEAWFTGDHEARAGYNAGSFWEALAKATMKQSGRFDKPNARAYRWVGDSDEERA